MATTGESRGRVKNLKAVLDKKYDKEAKAIEMQPEKLDRQKQRGQLVFRKTVSDFRILTAKAMPEAEMIKEGQSIIRSMKKDGNFDLLPADLQNDLSPFVEDEDTENKKGKESSSKPRPETEDTNQSVGAGSVKDLDLNPQQSTSSPMQARKYEGVQESKEYERLNKQIEELTNTLRKEETVSNKRKTELKEEHEELEKRDHKIAELDKRIEKQEEEKKNLQQEERRKQQMISKMEKQLEDNYAEQQNLHKKLEGLTSELKGIKKERQEDHLKWIKEKKHLEKKHEASMAAMFENMADDKRKHESEMQKLTKDRDDIRDRFSKLAGAKLSDQNADIADLSDPNRAMKLSERFGQLYDDEWTNAFETLTDKKIGLSLKEAINFLLRLLQDCWIFCNSLLTSQMESLHNVFLHPAQDMAKIDPRKNVGGLKDRPRIGSKEEQKLREVRRMIGVGPSVIEEVKQSLLSEVKSLSKEKTGYDKKHIDACAPYIQRCAEVCWLMAVHDPPLYMKMDVKPGEKLDTNVYSVYSSSGNTIDFLVWPPLLNGKDGGLLAKGVAEPQKIVGKKK